MRQSIASARLRTSHALPSVPCGTRTRVAAFAAGLAALLAACGGSPQGQLQDQAPGQIGLANQKPGTEGVYDGALYIVDPHQGGQANGVQLVETFWGRLVDVFDAVGDLPVYQDFVIGEDVRTEPGLWRVETNAATGTVRFTIEAVKTEEFGVFDQRLIEAQEGLSPVLVKGLGTQESPPFSFVARNATMVLRFNDLLDESTLVIDETLRVLTGNPPATPFTTRVFADPNHGGISGQGNFHSTRILVDMTVSAIEAAAFPQPIKLNGLGLPASVTAGAPNVALRIPTQTSPANGQFQVLRNLSGKPLSQTGNGPVLTALPTKDVVRAVRSGNPSDQNNGFLLDLEPPRILGLQGVQVQSANIDPDGVAGRDFLVAFTFQQAFCATDPLSGDLLETSTKVFLEVTQPGAVSQGQVNGLRVRSAQQLFPPATLAKLESSIPAVLAEGLQEAQQIVQIQLLGPGEFSTPWRPSLLGQQGCFVRFTPGALQPPLNGVAPNASILLRFSEPMEPSRVRPFDSFMVWRTNQPADPESWPAPSNLVVGEIQGSPDLRTFRFQPTVPFAHQAQAGQGQPYYIFLRGGSKGLADLAGNSIADVLPPLTFTIDPSQPAVNSGGFALRFDRRTPESELNQELGPVPAEDIRGQFIFEQELGQIRPRAVTRVPGLVDRFQQIPGAMPTFDPGVVTPLSQYGSKLQHIWRHVDMGYAVSETDDSLVNMDVEGVAKAPLGGQVVAANYPLFEMRLAHSRHLPDEVSGSELEGSILLIPSFPTSGLSHPQTGIPFTANILSDPNNIQTIVHPRERGFTISQADVFLNPNGIAMLRMPMNKGVQSEAEKFFYTYRDTTIQARGQLTNNNQVAAVGVPTGKEAFLLGLCPPVADPCAGLTFNSRELGVPSVGLPILIEYRCFPTETPTLTIFDISFNNANSAQPSMRAFSTGGINTAGNPVTVNPDSQVNPSGGFNAVPPVGGVGLPLGAPTSPADNTLYIGQLDMVTRVSRVYTRSVDTGQGNATFSPPVLEPRAQDQPSGTAVQVAWRPIPNAIVGGFQNAAVLDVYGERLQYTSDYTPIPWTGSIATLNTLPGRRHVQTRITFISNTTTGLSPVLRSYGLAYTFPL